ncbi:MAG: insulinase family protein [Legionellaceae bacterium]|nr:insulinase family protein [Legionellaceae bacterium]
MKRIWFFLVAGLSVLAASTAASQELVSQRWQTEEGMRVVFYPAPEVPMLELRLAFRAGSAYDGAHYGLSSLTASLIGNASKTMDADAIAEQFESVGAQFSGSAHRDMSVYSLRSLTAPAAYAQALRTFTETLAQARFHRKDFQREQQRQLTLITQKEESADQVATDVFYRRLYGSHPYAHAVLGQQETVKAITLEQVQQFYQRYYVAANAYLVLVGDLSTAQAKAVADTMSKSLPAGQAAEPVPLAKPLQRSLQVDEVFPSSQRFLRLGQLGIRYQSENYFPLLVGNYILGGSPLVSRLGEEVREKRGLTYGVVSQLPPLEGRGPFVIGLSTKTQQSKEALELSRSILQHFVQEGPSAEELAAAKQYLTGSFPLNLASNRQIADLLLRMLFYNLPEHYLRDYPKNIAAVTVEQIRSAMQQLIKPEHLLLVEVGPQ